ncbi:unnamed protein product [Caenorhabditis bovis]|uniref:U2A'/phosphoprotein 32 family A C-terminal domain-containing protein n=1 Tax=Caenorhabditis bovis TaxID=2654633 RepID=A0A8S1EN44_9PELO|nr:unnamed protein product [Caenorhabditis bovis]
MVKLTESAVYIRTKSSIENVKKLNLWGCCIDDISICEKMQALEVLSLSVNQVRSLEPLKHCHNLRELYLRKNEIQSLDELNHLKGLKNLRVLWIDENPCVDGLGPESYRRKILEILPQLTKLDDKPVTSADTTPTVIDDSVPECDMHASVYSARSNRSRSGSSDLITRSMYVSHSHGPQIFERIVQPQLLHLGDISDDEKPPAKYSLEVPGVPEPTDHRNNIMSQSMYGTLLEKPSSVDGDDEWNDFSIEEDRPMPIAPQRMYQSMHEGMMMLSGDSRRPTTNGRSVSMPRRRITGRANSTSPARDVRLSKIMSAVSVLLDELDADGLRQVVGEAQKRMKKQR